MQPDDRIRKGGVAVLGLYAAGALILAFAHLVDRNQWRLYQDASLHALAYRLARLVSAGGWIAWLVATVLSVLVSVHGFRRRKTLTRRSRAIAIACAIPPVFALVALGLFVALIISFRSSGMRYG